MTKHLWMVVLILGISSSNAQKNSALKNGENVEDPCSVVDLVQAQFEDHVIFVAWKLAGSDSIAITQLSFWIYDEKDRKGDYKSIEKVDSAYPKLNNTINKLIRESGCSKSLYSDQTPSLQQDKKSAKIGENPTAKRRYDSTMIGLSKIINEKADGYSYTINSGYTTLIVYWNQGRSQKVFTPSDKEFELLLAVLKKFDQSVGILH